MRLERFPECWRGTVRRWTSSLPFVVNPRGVLIHRVRAAATHTRDGLYSHDGVRLWCGNQQTGDRFQFFTDPPEDRLLCARCEMLAVAAGEIPADTLAGRHVHKGRLRAERTCCQPVN